MSMDKKADRLRRARRARGRIRQLAVHRLCVNKTPRHTYAQLIAPDGATVLACASTLEKECAGDGDKKQAATRVGAVIARRSQEKGVAEVAFDRSGFKYHGRIKALAEAAREGGLRF